jgi:hypothetical protein
LQKAEVVESLASFLFAVIYLSVIENSAASHQRTEPHQSHQSPWQQDAIQKSVARRAGGCW